MHLHLLVSSMMWINTYALAHMWSCDGVSDSHGSRICRILAPLVIAARVPRIYLHGFVIDLPGPGGDVGIVQRTVPCHVARLCTRVPCQLW